MCFAKQEVTLVRVLVSTRALKHTFFNNCTTRGSQTYLWDFLLWVENDNDTRRQQLLPVGQNEIYRVLIKHVKSAYMYLEACQVRNQEVSVWGGGGSFVSEQGRQYHMLFFLLKCLHLIRITFIWLVTYTVHTENWVFLIRTDIVSDVRGVLSDILHNEQWTNKLICH